MKTLLSVLFLSSTILTFAQVNCSVNSGVHVQNTAYLTTQGTLTNQGDLENVGVLGIKGHFENNGNYSGPGKVIFTGPQGSILCTDTIEQINLELDNGAFVTSNADLFVRYWVEIDNSGIDLEGNTLHLGTPSSFPMLSAYDFSNTSEPIFVDGAVRQNFTGTASFMFPVGIGDQFFPLMVNPATQLANDAWVQVQVHSGASPNLPTTNDYLEAYWDISHGGNIADNWDITFQYPTASVQGDELNLIPQVYDNSLWTGPVGSGADDESGSFSLDMGTHRINYINFSPLGQLTAFSSGPDCQGDLDGDGLVNTADLIIFLGDFGCLVSCENDFSGDGLVNTEDLIIFLGFFGTYCN